MCQRSISLISLLCRQWTMLKPVLNKACVRCPIVACWIIFRLLSPATPDRGSCWGYFLLLCLHTYEKPNWSSPTAGHGLSAGALCFCRLPAPPILGLSRGTDLCQSLFFSLPFSPGTSKQSNGSTPGAEHSSASSSCLMPMKNPFVWRKSSAGRLQMCCSPLLVSELCKVVRAEQKIQL